MKRIGYIYKYSSQERKGILVFGTWKQNTGTWGGNTIIKDLPIKFTSLDLLSEVKTGQLVYFELNDGKVANIEYASLANFDKKIMDSLIMCKKNEIESCFYYQNTHISFERLDNIIIPEKNASTTTVNKNKSLGIDDFVIEDLLDDCDFLDFDIVDDNDDKVDVIIKATENSLKIQNGQNSLPNTIDELYDCFGKYKHSSEGLRRKNDSFTLDILDLSLWVDTEIINQKYFGEYISELEYLYDLFVLRKRFNFNGDEIPYKPNNDCISPSWSLLLSKLQETELRKIIELAPKLQPALSIDFCKKNIDKLTDIYGMPDVSVCKLYCIDKIKRAKTVSEYKELEYKFCVYTNCGATHLDNEGVSMCKMGKRRINILKNLLEKQYNDVIEKDVISQFFALCDYNKLDVCNSLDFTKDEWIDIGVYIEQYSSLKEDFLDCNLCENILHQYAKLPDACKEALKKTFIRCVNEAAIIGANNQDVTPFVLNHNIELFGEWIKDDTKSKIKDIVNVKFANLDNLEELNDAYGEKYIYRSQYLSRYKQLTDGYNAYQFMADLSKSYSHEYPLVIQWYIVSHIIDLLGYRSLNSYNYVELEYNGSVSNVRTLLQWLHQQNTYGRLKDAVIKKAEEKACAVLTVDERWKLFEEKLIQSPGIDNIRKRLDKVYAKECDKKVLKNECFQNIMCSDLDVVKDTNIILFIADNLDDRYRNLMLRKAQGFLKLYLWQKKPTNSYDWNLIRKHFHELSEEIQIRVFRFVFSLIATGELCLSIDELYSTFVESSNPACTTICCILFILKEKYKKRNGNITTREIESIIGDGLLQRLKFLILCKEIFYPCNGYLALSPNQADLEYQSFNGVLTKRLRDEEICYVITFYEKPVDLFGHPIEWLDSKNIVISEEILRKNTNAKYFEGKYFIPESNEFDVKQFVMAYDIDDKCGLVSDKERMIELGYLPRNNAYQPLYTNCLRKYEDSNNYVCRGGYYGDSDPHNGIPFFWCRKKICVRRAHYLLPPTRWEEYRFADFLFIVFGQNHQAIKTVWKINAEISNFICGYTYIYKSEERVLASKSLNENDERGIWTEELSTYRDIYDDEYENDDKECDQNCVLL